MRKVGLVRKNLRDAGGRGKVMFLKMLQLESAICILGQTSDEHPPNTVFSAQGGRGDQGGEVDQNSDVVLSMPFDVDVDFNLDV